MWKEDIRARKESRQGRGVKVKVKQVKMEIDETQVK